MGVPDEGAVTVGDTWGISGSLFITFYAGVVLLVVLGTIVHRRFAFAGTDAGGVRLTPQQLAYLNAGPDVTVATSLAWLHGHGAVALDERGVFTRSGGIPMGATSLDAAIMQETSLRPKQLRAAPRVAAALDEIRDGLGRDGQLVTPEARRSANTGTIILIGLILLGIWRAIDGSANDRPIGYLVATLIGASIAALLLLAIRPRRTRAGLATLSRVRRENSHLQAKFDPSWQTYGADSTALAVGLYGSAMLWSINPGFAAATGVSSTPRSSDGGSAGYYGGDSGSGSGGDGGSSGGDGGGGGGCGGGCGG